MMPTLHKGDWVEDGLSFLEDDSAKKKPVHGIGYYIFPRDGSEWLTSLIAMVASAGFFALAAWQQGWNWWFAILGALALGYVGNIIRLRT